MLDLKVSKRSPIPIYEQLTRALERVIEDGELKPDDPLPSEYELAETYNISRMTVRRAINELAREGLVVRVPGKGTFVAHPKEARELKQLASFTEEAERQGLKAGGRVLTHRVIKPTRKVAEILRLSKGERVIELERIRTLNGKPVSLARSFLPYRLCPSLAERDLNDKSLYRILEVELGFKLVWAREIIGCCSAPEYVAELLGIKPGSAILTWERELFLEDETPLEYLYSYQWPEHFKVTFEIRRRK